MESFRVTTIACAAVALLVCSVVAACSGGGGHASGKDGGSGSSGGLNLTASEGGGGPSVCAGGVVGDHRPVQVRTFKEYECTTPAPLVLLLHDYGSSGDEAEAYFQLAPLAETLGFLYAHPDGTMDSTGKEFWNATDACCNVDHATVDDSTYLSSVLYDIGANYNVDPKRVYVFGYGNGGFMAYRLACDHAEQVTGVADLGGATWGDSSKCAPDAPLSALEIHGTNDATFLYDGGVNLGAAYPSAPGTIAAWVGLEQCEDAADGGAGLDLLSDDAGVDTTVQSWSNCEFSSGAMSLWTIQGGTHQPALAPSFSANVLAFLMAQRKP